MRCSFDFLGQKFGHILKKNSDLEQPRKLEICGHLEGDSGSPQGEMDLAIWQNNKVKVSHLSLLWFTAFPVAVPHGGTSTGNTVNPKGSKYVCVRVGKNDPIVGFIKGQPFMAYIVFIHQFCIGEGPEYRPFS
jgi:hypothetical protein